MFYSVAMISTIESKVLFKVKQSLSRWGMRKLYFRESKAFLLLSIKFDQLPKKKKKRRRRRERNGSNCLSFCIQEISTWIWISWNQLFCRSIFNWAQKGHAKRDVLEAFSQCHWYCQMCCNVFQRKYESQRYAHFLRLPCLWWGTWELNSCLNLLWLCSHGVVTLEWLPHSITAECERLHWPCPPNPLKLHHSAPWVLLCHLLVNLVQ